MLFGKIVRGALITTTVVALGCFALRTASANDDGGSDANDDAAAAYDDVADVGDASADDADAAADADAASAPRDACTPPISCYCAHYPCGYDDSAPPSSGGGCDVDARPNELPGGLVALLALFALAALRSRNRRT
ncbi:MAG TPA: hypothetical protein VGH28_02345 [Polyangiaceae bacterium]|jgi:hypothetical protein